MNNKIRIRAAGIVVHEDKILLNKFEKDGVVKYYNIVGGGLEDNETLKTAVKREIKEESGVDIEVGDLLFMLEYEPNTENYIYGDKYCLGAFFECKLIGSDKLSVPSIPDSHPGDNTIKSQAAWVHKSELLDTPIVPEINDELIYYIQTGEFRRRFIETNELKKLSVF